MGVEWLNVILQIGFLASNNLARYQKWCLHFSLAFIIESVVIVLLNIIVPVFGLRVHFPKGVNNLLWTYFRGFLVGLLNFLNQTIGFKIIENGLHNLLRTILVFNMMQESYKRRHITSKEIVNLR